MTCKMSITRLLSLALAAGATLALAGCVERDTGPVTTESRPVDTFTAIDFRGAAKVDVQVGPAPSLGITATPKTLAALKSRVEGGKLFLESGTGFWHSQPGKLEIRITVPELHAMSVSGAGDIEVAGLAGASLNLTLNGAADFNATGRIGMLTVAMNGAGDMDLSRLEATDATVVVNGAGSMDVNATGTLVATVNGVGSIDYYGKPSGLTTTINGVGSIGPHAGDK
jgi:hypothetical protein